MKFEYKNSFPICFLSKTTLLLFRNGVFEILNLTNGERSKIARFKFSLIESIIVRIPLFRRILRKGVRCGMLVSGNLVLFVIGQSIYELEIDTGTISSGYSNLSKSRPLVFTRIVGISGFKDGIYFGGYKGNPEKNPISVYRRVQRDQWEEIYQFPSGTIEHIHNIIPDTYRNVVYILTGDFDHSAGIWIAENGFRNVVPLFIGDQKFRGCVGFLTKEGLVYATDSPYSENSIIHLKYADNEWHPVQLMRINGPSIYGCQCGEDYVFSTSVEGDGREQSIWYKLFGRKKGSGITEDYSFIYTGNLRDGFKEIYKVRKDWLPFFLFQFGTLVFPEGLNESSYLPVYHIGTRKYGMNTILLELK